MIEPLLQRREQRDRLLLAQREPGRGIECFRFVLDGVQQLDPRDGFVRFARAGFLGVDELAARVRPAADFDDGARGPAKEFVVPGIGIALKKTSEVIQKRERTGVAAVFGRVVDCAVLRDVVRERVPSRARDRPASDRDSRVHPA